MNTITVELSFYPLTEDYEQRVIDFIRELRTYPQLETRVGGTSTIIRGEHHAVYDALRDASERFMGADETAIFVAKFLNTDAFDAPQID
jgi:uncharacterized protein YqgV (UPF0045/DUF77 family)